ncbi:unnamed protein product [Caenorhabditis brenneri]
MKPRVLEIVPAESHRERNIEVFRASRLRCGHQRGIYTARYIPRKIAVDIVEEQENSSNPVTVELEVAVARDDLNIEIIPLEQRSAILEELQKYIESERDEMLKKSDANENKEEKGEEKWDIVYLALKKVANILNKRNFLTSPLPIYNEAVEVFRTNRLRCGHQRGEESRLLDNNMQYSRWRLVLRQWEGSLLCRMVRKQWNREESQTTSTNDCSKKMLERLMLSQEDEVSGNDLFQFNDLEALRERHLELERLMLPQDIGALGNESFQFDERFPEHPETPQIYRPASVEPEAAPINHPAFAAQLAGGFVNYGEWPLQEDVEFQINTWTTEKVIDFVAKILHGDELLPRTLGILREEAIRGENLMALLDDRRRPEFLQYVKIPWGHADKIRRELTVVHNYWANSNNGFIY